MMCVQNSRCTNQSSHADWHFTTTTCTNRKVIDCDPPRGLWYHTLYNLLSTDTQHHYLRLQGSMASWVGVGVEIVGSILKKNLPLFRIIHVDFCGFKKNQWYGLNGMSLYFLFSIQSLTSQMRFIILVRCPRQGLKVQTINTYSFIYKMIIGWLFTHGTKMNLKIFK